MSPRMTTVLPFLLFLARFVDAQSNPCISFGKDFQDQGSYFQNSQSDDDFTFVQEFEGTADIQQRIYLFTYKGRL